MLRWMFLALCGPFLVAGCVRSVLPADQSVWRAYGEEAAARASAQAKADDEPDPSPYFDRGLDLLARDTLGTSLPCRAEPAGAAGRWSPEWTGGDGDQLDPEIGKRALAGDPEALALVDAHKQCRLRVYVWGPEPCLQGESSPEADAAAIPAVERLVPTSIAGTPLVCACAAALRSGRHETGGTIRIDGTMVERFGRDAMAAATDQRRANASSFGRMLSLYLGAWTQGKFVDRTGTALPAPSVVQKGKGGSIDNPIGWVPSIVIDNEDLVGFTAVAMAALMDTFWPTPVIMKRKTDGRGLEPVTGSEPTFHELFGIGITLHECEQKDGDPIQDCSKPGTITAIEYELIRKTALIAGGRSSSLTKLVMGLLKEAKIEFVLGAHFAIGDADSVRLMVGKALEVVARRATEQLVLDGMLAFGYRRDTISGRIWPGPEKHVATDLEKLVARLLEEQGLLDDLLPKDDG